MTGGRNRVRDMSLIPDTTVCSVEIPLTYVYIPLPVTI